MDAREPPRLGRVPFRVGGDRDPCAAQRRQKLVELSEPEFHHPRLVGRKIAGVGRKRQKRGRAGLLDPLRRIIAAYAQMLAIPIAERLRVA